MLTLNMNASYLPTGYMVGDCVNFYWNVNSSGVATPDSMIVWGETPWAMDSWAETEIDETRPINSSPIQFFPGLFDAPLWGTSSWCEVPWCSSVPAGPSWGEGSWGEDSWAFGTDLISITFETPAVHFGSVSIGGQAIDSFGNEQSGAVEVLTIVVNSTPRQPSDFRRSTYSGGQQAFTFVQSPQLKQG